MRSNILAIITIGIILAGCHKGPRAAVVLPSPVFVPIVVPVAAPVPVASEISASLPTPAPTPTEPSVLEQAELAFALGNYEDAINIYEGYLWSLPSGDESDQALFHVGIAYALRSKPAANWARATVYLKRLISEHPDSPLSPTATLILSLRNNADQLTKDARARSEVMQQLNTELQRLKKIDADRRKRP